MGSTKDVPDPQLKLTTHMRTPWTIQDGDAELNNRGQEEAEKGTRREETLRKHSLLLLRTAASLYLQSLIVGPNSLSIFTDFCLALIYL